ncbi:BT_3928 family protein [Lutimonas vermicola]|uniref:BT_3928 family protein n=1 Tax=Lutimonas vermicola TaxID=414288 RepID=A0ABU9KZD2_9FLAO
MRIITHIARFLVAVTFIFSGFVKLVDPLGSAYKFEEYFGADVLNLEFLSPFALQFSIVLILAEIMLGVMLLVGYKPKITVWSLFFISLLFLFLTWYSAHYDKVTDCGCFGDAIKLTPWETFYKNVILIVLVVYLLIRVYDIHPILSDVFARRVSMISFIVFVGIAFYVLRYLPIIDFRPYAIGKNIPEGMRIPEDAEVPVYEDTWIYKVDGENKVYTTEDKPWNIQGATFVDRKTRTLKEGYIPPIHDFTMEREGEDLTETLMEKEKLMLIVAYNLKMASQEGMQQIKELSERAMEMGYTVYCFSASTQEDYDIIKKEYNLDFDLLFCDETTLKTIVRSNPGIVTLNKGTITGKWSWRRADSIILDH